MRDISNLAHQAEGLLIGVAALIALVQAGGRWTAGWRTLAWPTMTFGAGVFLFGYLLVPHHGPGTAKFQWAWVFGDPQQRQHLLISVFITAGALSELLTRRYPGMGGLWRFGWPVALVAVGLAFVVHEQHGTSAAVRTALMIHRLLGGVLLVAGAARFAEILGWRNRLTAWLWPTALLAAAALLFAYREPPGAYEHSAGPMTPATMRP